MAVTKININGIQEIDFNFNGSTTATITSPGVVAITNDLTGEFVTHSLGPLTAGSVLIGNGNGDIKVAPMDYGVTGVNTFTLLSTNMVVNGNPATNGSFSLNNTSTGGSAWFLNALATGNTWAMQATASTALPFRGVLFEDVAAGVLNLLMTTVSGKAIAAFVSTGTFGWYAGASPVSTALDTGLSRVAPATVAVGNGTQGDASGQARFATHLGPAVAPTGSGPTGAWCFSQDGNISFCKAGTWEIVTTAP